MSGETTVLAPTKMTSATVGTSAAQILGANPTRRGLAITNLHATQTISIASSSLSSPTSLGAGTITIPAASTVIFGGNTTWPWAWTDVVNAIASGASTLCTLTEF
jgi:hypothetical protein